MGAVLPRLQCNCWPFICSNFDMSRVDVTGDPKRFSSTFASDISCSASLGALTSPQDTSETEWDPHSTCRETWSNRFVFILNGVPGQASRSLRVYVLDTSLDLILGVFRFVGWKLFQVAHSDQHFGTWQGFAGWGHQDSWENIDIGNPIFNFSQTCRCN